MRAKTEIAAHAAEWVWSILWCGLPFIAALAWMASANAQQPPDFSKSFSPDTIGPGSISTLTFTITEVDGATVTDLAFTDSLPVGVTIATPANPVSTCGGTLSAPDGGSTISLSNGGVGAGGSCFVRVDVSGSATSTNVSGDLTSNAGNSGAATATLTVATDRPGFTKSFAPDSVTLGSRSTLTFTIDNSANMLSASDLNFTDNLPVGIVIADPANAVTTCTGGSLMAVAGTSVITYSFLFTGDASVSAMSTCTVSVDVTATGIGLLGNTSGELMGRLVVNGPDISSGKASATLNVTADTISLTKSFTDDPVIPGDTVDLEFTITNRDRNDTAIDIAFTDDLDATLSGLVATGLPLTDVCGVGSQLFEDAVTGDLTLTGGNLAAGASCTFSVTLQTPAGATPGAYPNTTSSITADLGGVPFTGDPATETLFVDTVPLLTKTFLTDPVGAGDTVTVEFTIENTSTTDIATEIAFTDNISAFISGITVTVLPATGFCGAGSILTAADIGGGVMVLTMAGGSLVSGATCTFSVDLLLPTGVLQGTFTNTTSDISATINAATVIGPPAADDLAVIGAPIVRKSFTDDPVQPGGTATLEFTIAYDQFAPSDATNIAFTDDLSATLSGLAATGLPVNDVCGTGSQLSGTSALSLTGGTLAPSASCTFSVTVQVPGGALPGIYGNVSSDLTATVSGVNVTGDPAQDDLQVAGLNISKSFTDDPVLPGGIVTLEFTLDNTDGTVDATGIFFTDSLSSALSGLVATGLPMTDICGTGSSITGTSFLMFTGGNLLAGDSCTFSVTLQVPGSAVDGVYNNTTSNLTATIGATPTVLPPAVDTLTVNSVLLALSKTFTDDPVPPGGTATLEFTIENLSPGETVASIAFTDDLDAALSGLAAVGLPADGFCGAGSMLTGTSVLSLTGASLAPMASCTFSVTVQVPAAVALGTSAVNTTSTVTGNVGMTAVTGNSATDTLQIDSVAFAKIFDGPTTAGGTPMLTFTIENLDTMNSVIGLSFQDDLDAALAGLTATGLPLADVCGPGSLLSGTSVISLTDGNLGPGSTCTFDVTLQMPAGAAPGSYTNTSSVLTASGIRAGNAAEADLAVEPAPEFSKSFAPGSISTDAISTLTFTIDNMASALAASALDFTDNLPAGLAVANPANAATTCTGGTLTAAPGASVISYSGVTVAAGASCTVQVDVTGATAGTYVNTSDELTSSSGLSGTASATLTIQGLVVFSKRFEPESISPGGISTLLFTIDNSTATASASNLSFTDNLPASVVVADPPNASTDCTGGTLTAAAGASVISYSGGTVATGASCTVQIDVTGDTEGEQVNTSDDLTSSLGNSGPASATLTVTALQDLVLTKSFGDDAVIPGAATTLTFALTNPNALAATGISFTDDLDAVIPGLQATGLPQTDVCGAGSSISGPSVLSLADGSLESGGMCTFTVSLSVPDDAAPGTFTNTTSSPTSSLGSSDPASATLTVITLEGMVLTTSFSGGVPPGGTTVLEFTLTNPNAFAATEISFTDDLDAVIPGLQAIGLDAAIAGLQAIELLQTDVCGVGSSISGTSLLTFADGSLEPEGMCTFSVTLRVPSDAVAGTFTSTTSPVSALVEGISVSAEGASASLIVTSTPPARIPTLGVLQMLLMGGLLALLAVLRLRRSRKLTGN